MTRDRDHQRRTRALLRKLHPHCRLHDVHYRSLRGGLESPSVLQVSACCREPGRQRRFEVVMKELRGADGREAAIYSLFADSGAHWPTPRLLGIEQTDSDRATLCLEPIRPTRSWPWRQQEATAHVLRTLARLHESPPTDAAQSIPQWNYEDHLREKAEATSNLLETVRRSPDAAVLARDVSPLRRLASALPEARRWLLGLPEFEATLIHGDVHPGNVFVRRRNGSDEVILVDWARARIGSPLEDVASWLQSLAYWEPAARRRHDTLLVGYLRARALPPRLGPEFRAAYWIAAASNALSGALVYHLCGAAQPGPNRSASIAAARDWLRIIRRADHSWRALDGSRYTRN